MDGGQELLAGSVQRRLSLTLALAIAAMAVVAGALSFLAAYDEARELQDDVLRRVAQLVELQRRTAAAGPLDLHIQGDEDDTRVIVQGLGAIARPPDHVEQGGHLPLPATLSDGLRTLELDGEPYRVLVRTTAGGERFAVAQDLRLRRELARYGALRTTLPFLLLVPALLLVLARLVRQLFRPITDLAQEVDARGEQDLHPIAYAPVPTEVRPFVRAINRLLGRVDKSMDAQRRFVADAAHELRSPLTAMSLQAQRLAEADMSAQARERLATLHQGIERGRGLLDQLLSLAQAQAAGDAPQMPVSVQATFRQVLEDLMPLAEARHIDLGVEGSQDAVVAVSALDLFTMVKNLVDNALRYTPEGGRVDLSLATLPGGVELRVCDTGPGIALAERERVFDPFYRVLGSGQMGSGLGLAIVQTIAARLGARVTLDFADAAAQTGLRVTVTIPVKPPRELAWPA